VDQHPVARADAVVLVVEQADVDGAAHAGHVHPREVVRLVGDIEDLAGNGQAHVSDPPVEERGRYSWRSLRERGRVGIQR
jgi:hypothetical protein